jgi:hypothetical protein
MKYMFLLHGAGEAQPEPGTEEYARMVAAYGAATRAMAEAGVLVDCAPLQPSSATTTVQVRNGETILTDGPMAEVRKAFGGYTLVECADLDEALKWASAIPAAGDGSVEIRPVAQVQVPA